MLAAASLARRAPTPLKTGRPCVKQRDPAGEMRALHRQLHVRGDRLPT